MHHPHRYHKGTFRYVVGDRRAAKHRLAAVANPLQLVTLIADIGQYHLEFWSGLSTAFFDSGTIRLTSDLPPFDTAHNFAHEAGHLFDARFLDDTQRTAFREVVGLAPEEWHGGVYSRSPAEAFAAAFAELSCVGPWRNKYWNASYWSAEQAPRVLSTARAVIEAASHRRPPAATN